MDKTSVILTANIDLAKERKVVSSITILIVLISFLFQEVGTYLGNKQKNKIQ